MVHTTFQYGGVEGKRHRLREAMMWEDDPSYYETQMLRFEPDIPYSMVYPRGVPDEIGTVNFEDRMTVNEHFALVNHQLTQIRNAFALAEALNRVLVLPRLVCGLDRYWAPHQGIIPGSGTRLPLLDCPADHVIDLERFGGNVEAKLREHSLLCNPRTPASVLQGTRSEVLPPLPSSDVQALVRRLAREYASTTVLELAGPLPDYRSVMGRKDAAWDAVAVFEQQIKSYGSLWCCNRPPNGKGPGHVWYDFLWDILPHRDRHNRLFEKAWAPMMGP